MALVFSRCEWWRSIPVSAWSSELPIRGPSLRAVYLLLVSMIDTGSGSAPLFGRGVDLRRWECVLAYRDAGVRSVADSVLLLVSGFLGPGMEWRTSPIRLEARDHGWEPRYFHRRLVLARVDTNGERLAETVEILHRRFATVAVVGHSMGGLIAEHAAAIGAPIDAMVTLGTPHRGLPVPPSVGAAAQMREASDYLYALRRSAPATPTLAIAAGSDRIVTGERAFPIRPASA